MQPNRTQLQKVIEILQNTRAGVIALNDNPSPDAVAAATAMYLGLNQAGKNVTLACSSPIQSSLYAADKVSSSITTSGNDLVVSFPYVEGSVDKVDWEINNGKFNIIVTPRQGNDKVDAKQVQFSYAGGSVDFIITFDAPTLRALGDLYTNHQDVFKSAKIIVLDRHITNTFYGTANLVNRTVTSLSELTLGILHAMNIQIDKAMATNLYSGITAATNNFSSPGVNAGTFEASAFLLKQGAQKPGATPQEGNNESPRRTQLQTAPAQFSANPQRPMKPQAPNMQKSFERPGQAKPMNAIERDVNHYEGADFTGQGEEDEWLKPDIFGSQEDEE